MGSPRPYGLVGQLGAPKLAAEAHTGHPLNTTPKSMSPAETSPTLVKTVKEYRKLQEKPPQAGLWQQPTPPLKNTRLVRTSAVPVPTWAFVTP
jgi:hypothetical protein